MGIYSLRTYDIMRVIEVYSMRSVTLTHSELYQCVFYVSVLKFD